jgi:hypothetical protein
VLLFIIALTVVVPLDIVIFVRGVKLLPLGTVGDEVGGVATLEATLGDLLSSWNLCKV